VAVQFEVLPFKRAQEEAAQLPEPARLTVTSSPRHGADHTLDFAVRLAEVGHTVIPHLAAREVRDRSHLDQLLGCVAKAGIEDVFVIGGDSSEPAGEYASAGELLPLIRERVRTVGIAAYPEGHPQIEPETLARVLEQKSAIADYVVTQMCFDSEAVLGWLRETRERGVTLPVMIGLPGAVERKRLLEVSMRIGVGPSVAYVRKQRGLLGLLRRPTSTADKLLDALTPCLGEPRLNVAGFHYYTLNALLDTWNWEREKHIPAKEAK
jgi:methylenetetrahydrofolate reductase (NADPH)